MSCATNADTFPDFVPGDSHGLDIPAHPAALLAAGPAFLTAAIQAFGALPADNRVTRIVRSEICPGGSTGKKLFLTVEYARPDPALDTELFAKFSRDFDDRARDDRGKYEMKDEIRFAAISRLPGFPITVPTAYFADHHVASHTGLLITQRILFGVGGIERHYEKCLDHEIDAPLSHYRVIIDALARVAAGHRSGSLPADIDALFPFDAEAQIASFSIPMDEPELNRLVDDYAAFVGRSPQLMPAELATADFFAKLRRDGARMLKHRTEMAAFLQSDRDMIALCHWNANIDNIWFWHDDADVLQCGLIDWGRVGQMNLAIALWGCLFAAPNEMLDAHLSELIARFADEYHRHGGPKLTVQTLTLNLEIYWAMLGILYFLASPSRILFRLPEAIEAVGPRDRIFLRSETARNQLHSMTTILTQLNKLDLDTALRSIG